MDGYRHAFERIWQAISGEAAWQTVSDLSRYHRIQASPGYRAAAKYVLGELRSADLEAHVETFPADHQTKFWTSLSFQEWDAAGATLHLVEPADQARKLADYRELKISLIQRSISFDGEAEVVLLEDGLEENEMDVEVIGVVELIAEHMVEH